MNDTIVFASAKTTFEVVPSDLMPVIRGGIKRSGSRNETIVLDGSLSFDPDFPDIKDGL